MTTVYELPLSARAQTFRITLGSNDYQITQRFCNAAQAWFIDIDAGDGAPLLRGVTLITGVDLLSQFKHLGLEGQIVVQTDGDVDAVPTYDNLGASGHAYYLVD